MRRHVGAIYDTVTANRNKTLRVCELLYAVAERFPGLVPTRQRIQGERALKQQSAKEGYEIDQGLFIAHILADPERGLHLVHAMLTPKREALEKFAEFQKPASADLGEASVERKGNVGHVTLTNPDFLNAEGDRTAADLETAADLALLDDRIEVCVLRGGPVDHPKYNGRRIFNSGINLTHLYYGQIAFADFILERELGLLNKIYRGHWRSDSYSEQFEDYVEKPWLAAVESPRHRRRLSAFVRDGPRCGGRTAATSICLPARRASFREARNLRLPRLVGIQLARQGIFFERKFMADTPEGQMICDETVGLRADGQRDRGQHGADGSRRLHQHREQPQGVARRPGAARRFIAATWRPMRVSRRFVSMIQS